tara:strand:+ start:455 stop:928 length:474 start_codon:yes stop_codon:yes gene_type:complete
MSIITKIDGIPLFSKKEEALRYARLNNLLGFHTHDHFGKVGYMGGVSHKIGPNTSMVSTQNVVAKYYMDDDPRNFLLGLTPIDDPGLVLVNYNESLETETIDENVEEQIPEQTPEQIFEQTPIVQQQAVPTSSPAVTSGSTSTGGGSYSGGGGGGGY